MSLKYILNCLLQIINPGLKEINKQQYYGAASPTDLKILNKEYIFLMKKITVLLQIKRIIQEENLVIWIYKTLYQIWFPLTLR